MKLLGRFLFVGIVTALGYFSLLLLLVEYLGWPVPLASSIAYIIALVFNYLAHHHFTFTSSVDHKHSGWRYVIMCVTGFMINAVIMSIDSAAIPYGYLMLQAISIVVVVSWNLLLSRYWVYSHTDRGL